VIAKHLRLCLPIAIPSLLILSGCGGDSSLVLSKPASERPDVDAGIVAKGGAEIPGSAAFNYTTFRSGQTGDARGDARQVGKDGAACSVQAGANGSGWAECMLGYCFDNNSGASLDAAIHLKLRISQQTEGVVAQPQTVTNATSAKSMLQFMIKDTNGRILRTENLLTGDLSAGSGSASTTHDLVFAANFEPAKGYYLVLAGRIDVQAGEAQSSKMSLEIADASMGISWKVAEPAKADASSVVPASAK
jgi:hypothetical protein